MTNFIFIKLLPPVMLKQLSKSLEQIMRFKVPKFWPKLYPNCSLAPKEEFVENFYSGHCSAPRMFHYYRSFLRVVSEIFVLQAYTITISKNIFWLKKQKLDVSEKAILTQILISVCFYPPSTCFCGLHKKRLTFKTFFTENFF